MKKNQQVIHAIFHAIDEFNQQQPQEQQLEKAIDVTLFGKSGKLDSLGLVNLIVSTEQKIEEAFNVTITLADERAMSQKNSPFRTVRALADYISSLLEENANG